MVDRLTNLPPEVVSLVLWHLRPRDLRQCRLVNSAFNTLVPPLYSRYLIYDGDDFTFPFVIPDPAAHDNTIPRHINRLTVKPHDHCCSESRSFHQIHTGLVSFSSCQVLAVNLTPPDEEDDIASAHYRHFDPCPSGAVAMQPFYCSALHLALQNAKIDKLVLRNVPVAYGNVDPDLLDFAAFQTVREAVLLLDVNSMSEHNTSTLYDWYDFDDFYEPVCIAAAPELSFPEVGSLASALPPNVEDLTFVFWTTRPATEVAPFCCTTYETYSDCGDDDEVDSDREPAVHQFSCWEERFWRDLAAALAPKLLFELRAVTIVNASNIVLDGAARDPAFSAIESGAATHVKAEKKFRGILHGQLTKQCGMSSDEAGDYVDRVKFKYMKDWLVSTDWEDVFTWKEVKPWLQFKRSLITDYFKPVDRDAVKWRNNLTEAQRFQLRVERSSARKKKPNTYNWRH